MEEKRFAVLLCAEDSEFVKKRYGGYFGVFVSMLGEEGERWDCYRVCQGEFPKDGEMESYDGFVLTGSPNDAHSNVGWICRLMSLLKRLDSMHKKVLGICFGHQILCRALGGKTGRAANGWDIGMRTINPSTSHSLSPLQIPSPLKVLECHQDEVWEMPATAEVLGRSDKTGIEMFRYGEHMMGIQGHPEYTKDILTHLMDRLLHRNLIQVTSSSVCLFIEREVVWVQEEDAEKAKASMEDSEPDQESWKKLCRAFLKS
ncbi:hypothetical protein ACLOJK_036197 [Asimina triloba]